MTLPRPVEEWAEKFERWFCQAVDAHQITSTLMKAQLGQILTDYAAQQVTQARKDLFQILVNRLSCDLAGLEEVPSDAAFVAMLDQLEFNARAERD